MKSGVQLIQEERLRQIAKEGYDSKHDDLHNNGELAMMAACYAAPQRIWVEANSYADSIVFSDPFPFEKFSDKRRSYGERKENTRNTLPNPNSYTIDERIDLLTKAGALIAAEIDLLNRRAGR